MKNDTLTDNSAIKICVNEIENRNKFRTKTGYYLLPFNL